MFLHTSLHPVTTGRGMALRAKKPRLLQVDKDTYDLIHSDADQLSNDSPYEPKKIHYDVSVKECSQPNCSQTFKTPSNHPVTSRGRDNLERTSRKPLSEMIQGWRSPIIVNSEHFVTVTGAQVTLFLKLLDFPVMLKYMKFDICMLTSDKYLLAMAFAYFARAGLSPEEYTPYNLLVALYLAHDMEEDEEDYKYEIFPWALGRGWRNRYKQVLLSRDALWKRMGYRAVVSRRCCDEIMAIAANHPVWNRTRPEHHSGAIRPWNRDPHDKGQIIGPDGSPRHCKMCGYPKQEFDDSISPENDKLWLQLESSHSSEEQFLADMTTGSSAAALTDLWPNNSQQKKLHSDKITGNQSLEWVDCDDKSPVTFTSEV